MVSLHHRIILTLLPLLVLLAGVGCYGALVALSSRAGTSTRFCVRTMPASSTWSD